MWTFVVSMIVLATVFKVLKKYFETQTLLIANGEVVFISGCDTGIGNQLALHFAAMGCTVFAGCLRAKEAREKFPRNVRVIPLDITSEASVNEAVEDIKDQMIRENMKLWCLINNAGVCVHGEFEWLTMGQCIQQVEVNLLGTIRLTKACQSLIRKNRGRIINVTSINGFLAYPGLAVYSATKFALEGFSDTLRAEMKPRGVKVIVVQPGDLAKLTSIMADHRQNALVMWNAMDEEDKRFYSDYFTKYQKATTKNYGLTSPPKFEDSPLLSHIQHAVLAEEPKSRYTSVPFGFRIAYKLVSMLPDTFRDYIFIKIFEYVLNK